MLNPITYRPPSVSARLLLLAILVIGQCCLMAAPALAGGHGVSHSMSQAVVMSGPDLAVTAIHADSREMPCCLDAAALISAAPPVPKPMAGELVVAMLPPVPVITRTATASRGPPPGQTTARTHVQLQIYLI